MDEYKEQGLGYISIICQLTKDITSEEESRVFTAGQLKQIFDLSAQK